jgi:hypothetical protein
LSQHYIVKINDSRAGLFEWEEVSQLWAEIQVRTVLQHAWAAVEHFLVYKNKNDVPKLIRRRLFRLSALFELADEELDQLVSEINEQARQYKNELNEGNTKIEMNIDSLRTYIETSYEPKYWAQYLTENVGVRVEKDDWGDLSRDIEIANYFGLKFIDDVNSLLANAHGWGEIFFWNYYESVFKFFGVSSGEVSSVTNAPLTYLMIASHAEKITRALLDKEFGMLSPELLESALKARGIKSEVKD